MIVRAAAAAGMRARIVPSAVPNAPRGSSAYTPPPTKNPMRPAPLSSFDGVAGPLGLPIVSEPGMVIIPRRPSAALRARPPKKGIPPRHPDRFATLLCAVSGLSFHTHSGNCTSCESPNCRPPKAPDDKRSVGSSRSATAHIDRRRWKVESAQRPAAGFSALPVPRR
jgi:hypothetical protein